MDLFRLLLSGHRERLASLGPASVTSLPAGRKHMAVSTEMKARTGPGWVEISASVVSRPAVPSAGAVSLTAVGAAAFATDATCPKADVASSRKVDQASGTRTDEASSTTAVCSTVAPAIAVAVGAAIAEP